MIEIHPTTAFLLYLAFTLGIVLLLWIFRRKKTILPQEYALHTCEYCAHGYIDKKEHKLSRCPQCLSMNTHST